MPTNEQIIAMKNVTNKLLLGTEKVGAPQVVLKMKIHLWLIC